MRKCYLKKKIGGLEEELMNAKQAAKRAYKIIASQEYTLLLNKLDIRDYNKVIADMIAGESPCPMCEDWNECQLEAKAGKGCSEWMLRMQKVTQADMKQEGEDAGEEGEGASEAVHVVGANS